MKHPNIIYLTDNLGETCWCQDKIDEEDSTYYKVDDNFELRIGELLDDYGLTPTFPKEIMLSEFTRKVLKVLAKEKTNGTN